MADSSICIKTEGGLKPLKNQGDILVLKCERLASCDGSPEIKIPEEIKDEFVLQSLRKCNEETKKMAAESLRNQAKPFSSPVSNEFRLRLSVDQVLRTGLSPGFCCGDGDSSRKWLILDPIITPPAFEF